MWHCHTGFLPQILNYKKEDQMTAASNTGVSRRRGGLWSRKSNYLCIYISHIVITSLIVPPLSPPLPLPPLIISSFIRTNKHTIGALWIQRICFPLSQRAAILWWLGSGELQSNKSYFWLAGGPPKSLSNSKEWSLAPQIHRGDLRERPHRGAAPPAPQPRMSHVDAS